MAEDGEETTYEDVQTSYDTSFDRLINDAFPSDQMDWGNWFRSGLGLDDGSIAEEAFNTGEEYLHTLAPGEMGLLIETRLGDDLAALQNAPEGSPEAAAYQELVTRVAEIRPSNAEELLSVYKDVASPETYTAIIMTQAGVSEQNIGTFLDRLSGDEVVRERMADFIDRLETGAAFSPADGEEIDATSLFERIEANGPLIRSIAANPDGFFELARSDVFEDVADRLATHINSGGTLDQQGVADFIAAIPLQEKAAMFMEMGGASQEEIAEFQQTLDTALEANPDLAGVIDTAIINSVNEAASGPGATGNVFETLQSSAETFAAYANSSFVTSIMNDPMMIDEIVTQSRALGDDLTLTTIQDVGIESVVYEDFGRMMALGNLSPAEMMFGGSAVNAMINQAKAMRDNDSLRSIEGNLEGFENILRSVGLDGIVGGLGNVPGFLPDSMAPMAARFGMEMSPTQQTFALMDQAYIFDGSDGYPAIDYARIGRNHANNVWDASGNVRDPSERNASFEERLAGDAMALARAQGIDVDGMLAEAEAGLGDTRAAMDGIFEAAENAARGTLPPGEGVDPDPAAETRGVVGPTGME